MRFLLRCIFWLSIVYTSILSDVGGRVAATGRDDLAQAAHAAITAPTQAVVDEAAAGLSGYCRRAPSACLADSARLTALAAASDGVIGQDEPAPASRRQPMPEPRHRARGAMQARMP